MNERVTYRDKTVPWSVIINSVQRLGDVLVCVNCTMPTEVQLSIGDTIAIDVQPTSGVLRRYTVSSVSTSAFEFIAFRTQRGPATAFLDMLSDGGHIHGQGPERPVKLPTGNQRYVVVLGDETVVGTAVAVLSATASPVSLAIKTSLSIPDIPQLNGITTCATCDNDDDMKQWLTDFVTQHGSENVEVFLVGEQSANQLLRQHAFSLGVSKENLATRTFWRPDKAGLE